MVEIVKSKLYKINNKEYTKLNFIVRGIKQDY